MAMNPVEQRVLQMCQAWAAFRDDPAARVLVWRIQEDALRMVDVFIEMQKHQTELTTGDTFILFKTPYAHGLQYSRALKESLVGQFEATKDSLAAQGLPVDWAFNPATTLDAPAGVAQGLLSFGSKYHQALGHLTPVFMPLNVNNAVAWEQWLQGLLAMNMPERMRMLVIEVAEYPKLQTLLARPDPRVVLQDLNLDMGVLAQETFAQEPPKGPAGVFRNLLMGVVTLTEKGKADQVKAKAADALAFTRQQKWPDQEVAVRVLVAGSLLKESRHAEAIKVYEAARQAADVCVQSQHPAGHKLVLQTWFGQAGAELARGDERAAAASYDEAAVVAQRDNNPILTIEGFRMAGFCLARCGEREAALERGQCAANIAQALPPEGRALTTIGTCLVDMMRVLDAPRVEQLQRAKLHLKQRMEQVRQRTEQRGAELAAQAHPDALSVVDKEQAQQTQQAQAETRDMLQRTLAGASPEFTAWVHQGDALLGADWLLLNDLALPPTYVPPEEAASAGGPSA
jgi:hypothetical protein